MMQAAVVTQHQTHIKPPPQNHSDHFISFNNRNLPNRITCKIGTNILDRCPDKGVNIASWLYGLLRNNGMET